MVGLPQDLWQKDGKLYTTDYAMAKIKAHHPRPEGGSVTEIMDELRLARRKLVRKNSGEGRGNLLLAVTR